jgi:hypothetical protein
MTKKQRELKFVMQRPPAHVSQPETGMSQARKAAPFVLLRHRLRFADSRV